MIDTEVKPQREATMNSSLPSTSSLISVHKEFRGPKQPSDSDTEVSASDPHHEIDVLVNDVSSRPMSASSSLPPKSSKKRKTPPTNSNTSGRWTVPEHEAFLRGLSLYGREWKRVAADIPTRTSAQVRSHAQKYFAKIAKTLPSWEQPVQQQQPAPPLPGLPESVRRQAERIMADPRSVATEVQETLEQLKTRYAELQRRLQQQQPTDAERIAVDVLQGGLSHST